MADFNPLTTPIATPMNNPDGTINTIWNEFFVRYMNLVQENIDAIETSGGISSAIVMLYKRAATVPSVPSSTLTYTFSTGVLSGTLDGWAQSVPTTNGNPCWVTGAVAIATSPDTTDTILTGEWDSPPAKFVEDGSAGVDGAAGTSIIFKGSYASAAALISDQGAVEDGWSYYNTTDKKSYVYYSTWYQMTIDGVDGSDGENGEDGLSIVWKGDLASPPSSPIENWVYRDTDNGYVYIYNGSAWELMVLDGSDGTDGSAGEDGLSVFITYHDNDITSTPDTPTGDGTSDGWYTAPSADSNWMSQKIAESASSGTWGAPISIVGDTGAAGLNQGVIYLYQRKALPAPTLDMDDPLVYTFSTGVLTGSLGTWSLTIPTGTNPLYVTAVYTSANTTTDSIALSRWSTPVIMAQNGEDGADGEDGEDGADGDPGPQGPGLVYRGPFAAGTFYYTVTRRDVVYYSSNYYLYDIETTTSGNYESSWSSGDWVLFSNTFESVATKLLLAEDAAITKNLHVGGGTGANTAGMSGVGTSSSDIRIWAGSATKTSAPFRVTQAGALYASNATLSGTMTIGAGSSYTGNQISASYTAADVNTIDAGDGLAALDSAASTKLNGIETGAQVTSSVRINNALTSSTLAFSTSGKITFGGGAEFYGTSTTMTMLLNTNQQMAIANNRVTIASNAGYFTATALSYVSIGSTGDNIYLGGEDVYLNPESTGEIVFKFGSTEQMYANSSGFYPRVTATSSTGKYLGYTTKRWLALYTYYTYDYNSSFDDTFDDLYEISQFTSRKELITDSKTGKKIKGNSAINPKTGGEYLDLLSLPKRLTNYDQILAELISGEYGMSFGGQILITEEDAIEYLADYEELGWMIARDLGAFSSLTNGALRAKLTEDSEMFEMFASRLTALETENKELKARLTALESKG